MALKSSVLAAALVGGRPGGLKANYGGLLRVPITGGELAVVTAVAGGVLTQMGAWVQLYWQHKREIRLRELSRSHALHDSKTTRIHDACDAILDQIAQLKVALNLAVERGHFSSDDVQPALEAILRQTLILPDSGVRERSRTLVDLVWYSEYVAPLVDRPWDNISFRALDDLTELIGAVLRGDEKPDSPEWYARWASALTVVLKHRGEGSEHQVLHATDSE